MRAIWAWVMTRVALEFLYRWGLEMAIILLFMKDRTQKSIAYLTEWGRWGAEERWVAEATPNTPHLHWHSSSDSGRWHPSPGLSCSAPNPANQKQPTGHNASLKVRAGATLVRIRNAWPHDRASGRSSQVSRACGDCSWRFTAAVLYNRAKLFWELTGPRGLWVAPDDSRSI